MPQLDFSTYISQAFWLILCFCTLWFLLAVFVVPKLANVQEQRKRKINDYVRKAEKLNDLAKESLRKYENTLAQAQAAAENDLAQGRQSVKSYLEKIQREMTDDLNHKIAENEFVLAKEKNATMAQVEKISQDAAYSIAQKLGFKHIGLSDIIRVTEEEANE